MAALKKDFILFFSDKRGVVVLVLFPLLILLLFRSGLGDTASSRVYMRPFALAFRDMDDTPMSQTLIAELDKVGLFSEIIIAQGESETALFERDCACIIELPKDYFYDLYDYSGTVTLILNPNMPGEAALCEAMVSSVTQVISEARAGASVELSLRCGEDELTYEQKEKAANAMLSAGLSVLSAMNLGGVAEDSGAQLASMFSSCIITLVAFTVCLYSIKTLPEELSGGTLQRFYSSGGSMNALLLSKLLSSALIFTVAVTPFCLALGNDALGSLVLASAAAFLMVFILIFTGAMITKSASQVVTLGNLYLLFALIFGGCIYPLRLFPPAVQMLSWFSVAARVSDILALSGGMATSHGTLPLTLSAVALLLCLALDSALIARRWGR